jgi:hypothetical protein
MCSLYYNNKKTPYSCGDGNSFTEHDDICGLWTWINNNILYSISNSFIPDDRYGNSLTCKVSCYLLNMMGSKSFHILKITTNVIKARSQSSTETVQDPRLQYSEYEDWNKPSNIWPHLSPTLLPNHMAPFPWSLSEPICHPYAPCMTYTSLHFLPPPYTLKMVTAMYDVTASTYVVAKAQNLKLSIFPNTTCERLR